MLELKSCEPGIPNRLIYRWQGGLNWPAILYKWVLNSPMEGYLVYTWCKSVFVIQFHCVPDGQSSHITLSFSQINTRFFSRLMEHRRWRVWRLESLVILFNDKSRACRLFRFSKPSVLVSWFPLWIRTGKRTCLKRPGRDIHEYVFICPSGSSTPCALIDPC